MEAIGNNRFGTWNYKANDVTFHQFLSKGRVWEEHIVEMARCVIRPGSCVIDVGAHIGTHSIPYSEKAKAVYAFEMQPEIFALLQKNVRQNNKTNVFTQNCAVGHREGIAHINDTVYDFGINGRFDTPLAYKTLAPINYGGVAIGKGTAEAKMITLDSLNFENVSYMKVDAEGFEPMIFWGAKETIRNNRPVILFEKNLKLVTPEMIEDLQIPKEVYEFDIESFCKEELGYAGVFKVSNSMDFVAVPKFDTTNLKKLTEKRVQGSIIYEEKGKFFIQMNGRPKFEVIQFSQDVYGVFFCDVSEFWCFTIEHASISWSNETKWVFQ